MAKTSTLTPVDHDPFSVNPVDHDPFSESSPSVYDRAPASPYTTPSISDTSDLRRDPLKIGPGQETALERAVRVGIEAAGGFDVAKGIAAARQVLPSLRRGESGQAVGSGLEALGYGTMGLAGMAMPGRGRAAKAAAEAVRAAPEAVRAAPEAAKPFVPAAPAIIGKESTPLFDYSRLEERYGPQFDLPRYDPPQGVPERYLEATSPTNLARMNELAERGIELGGLGWYGTNPLREAYVAELGEKAGHAHFENAMNQIGATSPGTAVLPNIRRGLYMKYLGDQGLGIPESLTGTGYGHPYFYNTQARNVERFMPGGSGEWDVLTNPKPPSFAQDLIGNRTPVAIDRHIARAAKLVDTKGKPIDVPDKTGYGHVERAMQQEALNTFGIDPAQWQASVWLAGERGQGETSTNMRSGLDPFLKIFEDRLRYTADQRGETPKNTLAQIIRGKAPLLSVGGAAPIFLPGVDDQ